MSYKCGYPNTMNKQGGESPLTNTEEPPKKKKTVAGKLLNFYTLGASGAIGDKIKKNKESNPAVQARKKVRADKKAARVEKRTARRQERANKILEKAKK